MSDMHDAIKAAVEAHEPMTTAWVLTFETSELDDDGDLSGSWGILMSNPPSVAHLGLTQLAHSQAMRAYNQGDA